MGSSYMHVEWHMHAQGNNTDAYIGITTMLLNALDTPPPSWTYSRHRHIAYHERVTNVQHAFPASKAGLFRHNCFPFMREVQCVCVCVCVCVGVYV